MSLRLPQQRSLQHWAIAVTITGMLSAGAHANPFAPPDADNNADVSSDMTAPDKRDGNSEKRYDQATLKRIYGTEIAQHIIRRATVISIHDDKRRLLYEPTMNCYLEQVGASRIEENNCLIQIQERMYVSQSGVPEYPVIEMPLASTPNTDSKAAAEALADTRAGIPAVIADPERKVYTNSECDGAYTTMMEKRENGGGIVTFDNATQALREGYRRVSNKEC